MSESLRLLIKNERMSESFFFLRESLIRSFLGKKERIARKTDERIPSPAVQFVCDKLVYMYIYVVMVYVLYIVCGVQHLVMLL